MIGYIKGNVAQVFADYCFLETNGVGYRIFISDLTRKKLTAGTAATLYTYLHIREDAMLLYGFYTQDEYELFMLLLAVNGIGPKLALGVFSAISPADFRAAVGSKNSTALTKVPGVGKKTAERIVLELKDKISWFEENSDIEEAETAIFSKSPDNMLEEALQALQALGYNLGEVQPILKRTAKQADSVENLIKLALKELSRV